MTAPNHVLEPVEQRWSELNELVRTLGPRGLTRVGPDGWAVKDHLVHIAAWEHSLIALLEGTDRRQAMGVGPEPQDTDAINAAIWSLHRQKTPEQALQYFRETHAVLLKLLATLSDADLQRTYNHYQPNEPRDSSDDRPVVEWVAGNTYDHYAEHIGWIKAAQH